MTSKALALSAQASDARETLQTLEGIPCDTEANAALLGEVFVAAYAEANRLEAELKKALERVKLIEKARKARYLPAIDALRAVEAHVRTKTELAALDGIARREKGQEALVAAAREGLALPEAEEAPVLPGALTVSFDWTFELTGSGEDLDREFLEPSSKKITEFLKQYKNSSHVPARPGLRWKRICCSRAKPVKGEK